MSAENTLSIQAIGQRLVDLTKQAVQLARVEVDDIIESLDYDEARITRQLDLMLGFAFDPDMLLLFKRLCRHYFPLNPVDCREYIHAYRELWDTAEPEQEPEA